MIKNHLIILAWIKNLQLWQNGMYFKQGLYFYREKNGGKFFENENLKKFSIADYVVYYVNMLANSPQNAWGQDVYHKGT